MEHTWPDVLTGLIGRDDLSAEAAGWAMDEILAGNATPVQMAGFLVALRAKGESVDEIAGLADAMLARATPIELPLSLIHI